VQAGTVQRSSGFFRKAREIVKSGSLGDVTFCRVFQGTRTADWGVDPIDIVQFVFDEAMPLSVAAQGDKLYVMQATYRYAGFVGSYERRTVYPDLFHSGDNSIVFHGTKATLMANRSGYQLSMNHQNAKPVEERSLELAEMNMPHWANFLECIRSRQQPVSDIETCVRSTTTCLLADLACSHATALDWDDKSFTVRQTDLRPFLKAKYGERWRVT
jgi:predicted dehydrogenase